MFDKISVVGPQLALEICDQILQNRSKLYIRQNQTNTSSRWLHYCTSSFDTQYHSNYLRLVSTDVFSGWCVELEWWF